SPVLAAGGASAGSVTAGAGGAATPSTGSGAPAAAGGVGVAAVVGRVWISTSERISGSPERSKPHAPGGNRRANSSAGISAHREDFRNWTIGLTDLPQLR